MASAGSETIERESLETIAALRAQTLRYEIAFNNISQGACFFDAEQRLILCNHRYAEIYRLTLEQVRPGVTLREIAECRVAAGSCTMATSDYLGLCAPIIANPEPTIWIAELRDGRTIRVRHQPMPDGGWVATHEDITETRANLTIAKERVSLQALIDKVPDKLWVKDVDSRFVVANIATASEYGLTAPDLIGKTDFELYPRHVAQEFFDIEQKIIQSGRPAANMDECILDASGERRWLSTTKVPLVDERNEAAGLLGISRVITDRRKADVLRTGQAQILEMIASSAPLDEVLDRLMRLVESQLTGISASVLLLDEQGVHLRHGAAPSLADAYTKAIDGGRYRPERRFMWHGGLPSGKRNRRRHIDRPSLGELSGIGRRARLPLLLVDSHHITPRRGSRHLRDVLGNRAVAGRDRNGTHRSHDSDCRHRDRA